MPATIRLGLLSTTAIVGFAAAVLFVPHANADPLLDATWSGATSAYGTVTNWTPNTVPGPGGTATFDGAGSQIVDLGQTSYAPGNVQVTGGTYTFQNGAFTNTTLSLGNGTITQFGAIGADRTATTITSAGGFALAHSGAVTLINTGTISTPTADVFNGTANLTLLNSGTISSGALVAVNTSGSGTVTNAAGGVLQGGSHAGYGNGVNIYGTGLVDNYGSILGGATGSNAALQVGTDSTVNLRAGSTTTSVLLGDNSKLSLYTGTGTGSAAVIDPSGIVLQAAGTNAAAAVGSIAFGTGGTLNLRGAGDGSAVNGAAGLIDLSTVTGLSSLTKSDSGTWSLTGTSAPTGGTTFGGGVLNLGSAGAIGTAGTLSFTGGALQYSASNQTDYSARFSTAASQAYQIDTNGQAVTFATGLTSTGGSLTKLGLGTLTLSGNNTYTGGTSVTGGNLNVTGTLPGNVALSNGSVLRVASGGAISTTTVSPSINGNGTGPFTVVNLGSIINTSGRSAINAGGPVTLVTGAGSTISSDLFAAFSSANANSSIVNAFGATIQGGSDAEGGRVYLGDNGAVTNYGTMTGGATLAGGNNTSGALVVGTNSTVDLSAGSTTGTVRLGNGSTLSLSTGSGNTASGASTIDPVTGATIILQNAGTNAAATVGAITFGTGGTLALRGTGDGTAANGVTGALDMSTVSGVTTLSKQDSGTFVLTGSYGGALATNVTAGRLVASNTAGAFGTGTVAISTGATVELSNTTADVIELPGIDFTGAGTLEKTGAGIVSIGGTTQSSVGLAQGGLINVLAGTLRGSTQNNGNWSGNNGGLTIASGATFDGVEGAIRVDGLNGAGTLQGSATTTIGVADGSGAFSGTIQDSIYAGSTFALTKAGTGTQTLSGANTYTGGTTISAGTLQIGSGGTIGSITGNVVDNATLAFNRSDAMTFAGVVSGTGAVNQTGTGTLTLTGASTYTGDTTVSNGTLAIAAGGSITSNVSNIATFSNAGTVTGTFANSGTASNSGTVTGAATMSAGTVSNTGLFGSTLGLTGGSFTNNAGGTVAGTSTNNGGTLTNNGGTLAAVTNGSGSFANNSGSAGAVTNAGTATNTSTVASLANSGGTFGNTGTITGATTVSGGALTTTGTLGGGLTNSATVNANGGAVNGAIANNAGAFNVGGTVISNNTFANASGAIFAVAGTGSYTLQGMLTNAGLLTIANGGLLDATAGGLTNTSSGTVTVAQGGTLRDDLNNAGTVTNNGNYFANVASNSGSVANTATGTWTGNVASNSAAIGNAGLWTGNVLSNTGSLSNSGAWTGSIVTSSTFANAVGATVSGLVTNSGTTTNAGTFNGGLTNTAGTTTNNGVISGPVTVSGGILTGSGRTANLTVSGGIFAPGNGTAGSSMIVNGNLALASAVQYVVQVNPATASFTSVSGTAALGGAAVTANFAAGSYVTRQYTILNAAGGRTGTFGALTKTNFPANFNANLSYDANRAFIDLTLDYTKVGGLKLNQQNVANTLTGYFNRTGGIAMAFGSLSAAGLSQVSGEVGAGTQQATFDAMGLFMGLMTGPSTAGRGNTAPQGAIGYADEARAPADAMAEMSHNAPALQFEQRWNVWAAGFGGSQTTDGSAIAGSSTASSRIYGVAAGADYRISPNTTAGFALAGGGTNFSVANSGSGRSDLFQAGGFIRHSVGATYMTAALAYGWQDVTTDRSVGADRFNARFSTNTVSGRLEAGHRWIDPVLGMGLTPYAAAQVTSVSLPGYAEKAVSTNTFGLNYAGKDATATRSEIGLRTDKSFAVSDGVMTLRGRAAWAHNFDVDRSITATFQALPGASFVVNGAAQAREAALVTGSAEMAWLNGWSLAGTFEGEFSNVTKSYAGKGVVRYGW